MSGFQSKNVWGGAAHLFKEKALSADPVLPLRLHRGTWGLSQVTGTSDFYSPTHLARHGLLFKNTVGYLERFFLQSLLPGQVHIRGRWLRLTDWA